MNIDLNLFLVFNKIYAEQNLTKAASSLGLTQSAVSQALGRLRHHFDDELFYRGSQGMEPTEKAHAIAPYVSASLNSAEKAFFAVKGFDPRVSDQVFKIGMIDVDVVFLGPMLVNYFQKKAPKIQLKIVPVEPENYIELMDKEEINIAISCVGKKLPKRFSTAFLFHDELVVISKSKHSRSSKNLTLNEFLYSPHLSVSLGEIEKKFIDPLFSRKGIKRKVALNVEHMLGAPIVVKETDLIATVFLTLLRYCTDMKGLSVYKFPVKIPSIPISLVWHQRINGNRAYEWFVGEVKKVCGKINLDEKNLF
jgi:DNA-binding transcriptional LysR family regulator